MIEMDIDSVRVSLMNAQRVVILREKDTQRYLPIWIGPAEAESIAIKLQNLNVQRPLTHDLLGTVIQQLGGSVRSIHVSGLSNDTFFAKIVLQRNGDDYEIDSRPSDAIALAVRVRVPIFVSEEVLEQAGVLFNKETGEMTTPGDSTDLSGEPREVTEDELRRMSAFKDFVEELNMDLGDEQRQE